MQFSIRSRLCLRLFLSLLSVAPRLSRGVQAVDCVEKRLGAHRLQAQVHLLMLPVNGCSNSPIVAPFALNSIGKLASAPYWAIGTSCSIGRRSDSFAHVEEASAVTLQVTVSKPAIGML